MRHRKTEGNMLALTAVTALLLVAVMLFGLSFLNTTRGHMGQKTAAEAAALVAAQDIGRIVVDTPEFGTVGLCDQSPIGSGTIADDNYFIEVRSINELMATCRLNYIIGCKLNDSLMKNLALQDRKNILKAKDSLFKEINKSCTRGGIAYDAYGKEVRAFDDAEAIYLRNNAQGSSYVGNSMTMELGSLETGISTQSPVPTPNAAAPVASGESINGCYVSETNIAYNGEPFVFASTGKSPALGDLSKYKKTLSLPVVNGLSTQIASVVKIEADQNFVDQGKQSVQHFAAVATAGNDLQHPTGGALTVSYPDGPMPEMRFVKDLYQWTAMQTAKCDVLSVDGGDFPVDGSSSISAPQWPDPPAWTSSPPPAADVARLAIYDWIRHGGSRVNIDSVLKMQDGQFDDPPSATILWRATDPFSSSVLSLGQVPQGIMHIYSFDKNGSILYRSKTIKPYPYTVVSHKQLYAELSDGSSLVSGVAPWTAGPIDIHYYNDGKGNKTSFLYAPARQYQEMLNPQMSTIVATSGDVFEVGGGHGGGGDSKGGDDHDGEYKTKSKGAAPGYSVSTTTIQAKPNFDFYCRDMVRQRGADYGGLHEGEPMDNPIVGSLPKSPDFSNLSELKTAPYSRRIIGVNGVPLIACGDNTEIGGASSSSGKNSGGAGGGAPPIISRQDDFSTGAYPSPPYRGYSWGPGSGAPRPTYQKSGMCADLRFRRQLNVNGLSGLIGGADIGYVGEML